MRREKRVHSLHTHTHTNNSETEDHPFCSSIKNIIYFHQQKQRKPIKLKCGKDKNKDVRIN